MFTLNLVYIIYLVGLLFVGSIYAKNSQDENGECMVFALLPFTSRYEMSSPVKERFQRPSSLTVQICLSFSQSYEVPEGIPVDDTNQYNFFSQQSGSRLAFSYSTVYLAVNHFNS